MKRFEFLVFLFPAFFSCSPATHLSRTSDINIKSKTSHYSTPYQDHLHRCVEVQDQVFKISDSPSFKSKSKRYLSKSI